MQSENTNSDMQMDFGVASVLGSESEVFYCPLFDPKHIGMISDVLLACFKDRYHDEIKFRALLAVGSVYGFKNHNMEDIRQSPLLIECGITESKIGIAISFQLSKNVEFSPDDPDFTKRILERRPKNEFEKSLTEILSLSGELTLKFSSKMRKTEIICVLNLKPEQEAEKTENFQYVLIETEAPQPAVLPKSYRNLGDINYRKLLYSGEKDNFETQVAGSIESADEMIIVSGGHEALARTRTIVPREQIGQQDLGKVIVTGQNEATSEQGNVQQQETQAKSTEGKPENELEAIVGPSIEHIISFIPKEEQGRTPPEWTQNLIKSLIKMRGELYAKVRTVMVDSRGKELMLKKALIHVRSDLISAQAVAEQKEKEVTALMTELTKIKSQSIGKQDQKVELLQKMLAHSKMENTKVLAELSEFRRTSRGSQSAEMSILQSQMHDLKENYDRLFRQAEELKKANRQLMIRLNEGQGHRGRSNNASEELKQKHEATLRLYLNSKKETEDLKKQIELLNFREFELNKELKVLKSKLSPAPPASSSGAAPGGGKKSA